MSNVFFDPDTGDTLDIPDDIIINYGESDTLFEIPGDAINPEHYHSGGMEAIDVMEAFCTSEEFRGHLKCCAIKYLLRLYKKNTPLENAEKAQWYVTRLIKKLEDES